MIKHYYKLSIILTLYHTLFPPVDAFTVNSKWNISVASCMFGGR